MKKMKKALLLMMSAMLAVGVLAGCGGGDKKADSGKKWIVATDTVFKPFEYTDKDGNFVGIDVDILAAVAEDQGFDYELKS
ncbi:MAG: transporter substrate-binding domain-containing protein, partial [Acutalibacteraceae bacterium]